MAGSAGILACYVAQSDVKMSDRKQVEFPLRLFERWQRSAGKDACAPSQEVDFSNDSYGLAANKAGKRLF